MNESQVKFAEGVIRVNRNRIAELRKELLSVRLRKPETRLAEIQNCQTMIDEARKLLDAAAPELLEALGMFMDQGAPTSDVFDKATGEQQC